MKRLRTKHVTVNRSIVITIFLVMMTVPIYSRGAPSWINGIWKGMGKQFDTGQTWEVVVTANALKGIYRTAYPSLQCGGELVYIGNHGKKAYFREILTYGHDKCLNRGKVELSRKNKGMIFRYSNPGSKKVDAVGLLMKAER